MNLKYVQKMELFYSHTNTLMSNPKILILLLENKLRN